MTYESAKSNSFKMSPIKMPTALGAIGGATLLLLGVGFYASPYLMWNSMKGAIDRGDTATLAENVDFPELRSSMKTAVRGTSANQSASSNDPLSSMGAMLTSSILDPMIDKAVTPEGLAVIVKQASNSGSNSTSPQVSMGYESFNSFVVKLEGKNINLPTQLGVSPSLLFSRSGLGWKLTGVRM
jgi:hypothetical protein